MGDDRGPVVFDRAKLHLESVRALGLPDHQAYVHAGLFFGWAVERGLVLPWVERGAEAAFDGFRRQEITGPALFRAVDGALIDDQFTDEGLAFVAEYYDPRHGAFIGDYLRTLGGGLPSEFHVQDDAANAARLAVVLDERLAAFRARWDAAAGRPNLRIRAEKEQVSLPERLVLPVVPITTGIPLPHGPLGIRAGRPATQQALARALAADRLLLLVPVVTAERAAPGVDDLGEIGVVAEVDTVTPAPDRPSVQDMLLSCVARAEIRGWADPEALVADVSVLPEVEPVDEDDFAAMDAIRHGVAAAARRRSQLGEGPGMLALGAVLEPGALLDVVARELPAARTELATVLEAPDFKTRAEVVRVILDRELGG